MIYAWKCKECHHEWQGPERHSLVCAWCGGPPILLGKDKSGMSPEFFRQLMDGSIKDA